MSPLQFKEIVSSYGTPVWIYDAEVIRSKISDLKLFDVIRFAQKACSNTHILRLMREQGVKIDSVSKGEIERALVAGYKPEDIVFTADLLDRDTLEFVLEHNITVNVGSIDMLAQLGERHAGHKVWLRINPGFGHGHSQKTNTGGETSKHGIWHEDLKKALAVLKSHKLHLVGIHMHIGSGVDYAHLQQVGDAMVSIVTSADMDVEAISCGGGLSVPYKDGDAEIDIAHYFEIWDGARKKIEAHLGHAIELEIEPGRYLVAESGKMITEIRAVKNMGSLHYALVDAGFTELVRPAMYGSYHKFTPLDSNGSEIEGDAQSTVVAGPLCESCDMFTQKEGGYIDTRNLPSLKVGDYLLVHTTGAYGAAMSSNYNSRPLIPEVLIDGEGVRLIRRRQKMTDLLALEMDIPEKQIKN